MNTTLKILLSLTILNWSVGFSQDTQIQLGVKVAKLVATDLIEGDSAKEQLHIIAKEAELLKYKLEVKDSIIYKKDDIIKKFKEIVVTRDQQLKTSKELSKKLNIDLKKQKAKAKMFKLGSGVLTLVALALVL